MVLPRLRVRLHSFGPHRWRHTRSTDCARQELGYSRADKTYTMGEALGRALQELGDGQDGQRDCPKARWF